jgi:uncharacterized protein
MQLERVELEHVTVVTGYGDGGFKVAGRRYEGSLLLFEEVLHFWPVTDAAEITLESIEPLISGPEKPDLLLFGTGQSMKPLPPEVMKELRERGFAVETMDTGAACRTYSFLATEGRRVAGALIAV